MARFVVQKIQTFPPVSTSVTGGAGAGEGGPGSAGRVLVGPKSLGAEATFWSEKNHLILTKAGPFMRSSIFLWHRSFFFEMWRWKEMNKTCKHCLGLGDMWLLDKNGQFVEGIFDRLACDTIWKLWNKIPQHCDFVMLRVHVEIWSVYPKHPDVVHTDPLQTILGLPRRRPFGCGRRACQGNCANWMRFYLQ